MDFITDLMNNFNPEALLPDLGSMLGKVELLLRIFVMLGPLIMLILGLCYLLLPPKEANHGFGYRFFWGMSSVEVWRFTQKLAGIVWSALGLVLTVVMLIFCTRFSGMETMDMVWTAVKCVLWELGLLIAACLGVDIAVLILYNRKGERRGRAA